MSEIARRASNRERILRILQDAAPRGVTTWQLIEATHHSRAAGRVWELRKEHEILKVEDATGMATWFYIRPWPRPPLVRLMEAR